MTSSLDSFKSTLDRLFAQELPGSERHDRARDVLKPMVADPSVLEAIIKRNLEEPGFFLRTRDNPVIALKCFEEPAYTLVVNCWLPRPDRRTDISHQSIHHHGHLLLTSISAFGPGYESILFRKGFKVDRHTKAATIEIEKIYRNRYGHLEFVDSFTPHIVFYPPSVTVTYALWSNEAIGSNGDRGLLYSLKKNPFIRKYRRQLKSAMAVLGFEAALGLNDSQNLDFYPENGCIRQMQRRMQYKPGGAPRENLSQNFMYFLRETKFQDMDFIARLRERLSQEEQRVAGRWLTDFLSDFPISDSFDPEHLHIDKVTLNKEDILGCFENSLKRLAHTSTQD